MRQTETTDAAWTLLDHTADVRMEVKGRTLEELFVNAALGLTSLLTSEPAVHGNTEIEVVLEGVDREQLIVDWLREILFRNQVDGFVLADADIEELTENRIKARLSGCRALEQDAEPGIEIKAVTYHGLSIDRTDDGYRARILFDV